MISLLQSARRRVIWPRRRESARYWTDTEIRKALHVSTTEFERARKAWLRHVYPAPKWTARSASEAVLKWAIKQGSWPTATDMADSTDLPSRHQLYRIFGATASRTTMENCIENIWRRDRESIPSNLLMAIRNVTLRREYMEARGVERILREGGGEKIQQDDFGTLWRMRSDNQVDRWAIYVEVVNSTPEPDGSYAHYFLRVPPTMRTAQWAVAWSFEQSPFGTFGFAAQT